VTKLRHVDVSCSFMYEVQSTISTVVLKRVLKFFFLFSFLCFFILFRASVNVPKKCLILLCDLTVNSSLVGKSVLWLYRRISVLVGIAIDASFFDTVYGLNPDKEICKC